MQINKINQNIYINNTSYLQQNSPKYNKSEFLKIKSLPADTFIKSNNKANEISFTSNRYQKIIQRYLENKSLNRSRLASNRPYLTLDKELDKITKLVDIPVNKNESIQAFDINPKNSENYFIFLHGFSQNITSNQPLYKSLAKSKFGILAIDYRGYGKNQPSKATSQNSIIQDVYAAIRYLRDKGVKRISLLGHSFGTHIATRVSLTEEIDTQVLVSPMLSLEFWLKNVIRHPKKYPREIQMIKYIPEFKDQYAEVFNTSKYITKNKTATYIIHANRDNYIRQSKVGDFSHKVPNLKVYTKLKTGGHKMDQTKIEAISEILNQIAEDIEKWEA